MVRQGLIYFRILPLHNNNEVKNMKTMEKKNIKQILKEEYDRDIRYERFSFRIRENLKKLGITTVGTLCEKVCALDQSSSAKTRDKLREQGFETDTIRELRKHKYFSSILDADSKAKLLTIDEFVGEVEQGNINFGDDHRYALFHTEEKDYLRIFSKSDRSGYTENGVCPDLLMHNYFGEESRKLGLAKHPKLVHQGILSGGIDGREISLLFLSGKKCIYKKDNLGLKICLAHELKEGVIYRMHEIY